MTERTPSNGLLVRSLAGALLMFAGWLLAILPVFQHLHRVWLVVVVAVVLYGLVLVPSSLDIFTARARGKRGAGALAISLVPALAIFVILVVVAPLSFGLAALALAVEVAGMALYGWAWWRFQQGG